MTDTTKQDALKEVGRNALASLREMVAALECDYDRLETLRAEEASEEDAIEIRELEAMAGECESREDAEEAICEDPLSIEYRSGWTTDKSEMQAEEVKILLTTGGPAVQILVELDNNSEPHRAYMQVQDWGTPWTDYYEDGIDDVLTAYVGCFCFE